MSNLLPPPEKKQIISLYKKRFMSVTLFSLSVIILVGVALLLPSIFFLNNVQKDLTNKKNSFAGKETTGLQASLTSSINDINSRLDVFSENLPSSPLVNSFLDPILSAKTSTIKITNFEYTVGAKKSPVANIQVSGIATSREALLAYSNALSKIEGVSNVNVPIQSFLKNSDVVFTVSAQVSLK